MSKLHPALNVYGGLYFLQRDAERTCDGLNEISGVDAPALGSLRLEGPYIVRPLVHINTVLVWIVTKED